jgi:hypothetical protein
VLKENLESAVEYINRGCNNLSTVLEYWYWHYYIPIYKSYFALELYHLNKFLRADTLRQLEYGILSQRTVKNWAKRRKTSIFLKPLLPTGENSLINQPIFAAFYRSEMVFQPAGPDRSDRTDLKILDRLQLWMMIIHHGSKILNRVLQLKINVFYRMNVF